MTKPPGEPSEPDDGTIIVPAGEAGRPKQPEAEPAREKPQEATRVIVGGEPPATEKGSEDERGLQPRPDLVAGTLLGNYQVGKLIARGGLGAIYDGFNVHNPAERVAIKTILPEPGMRERFAKLLLDEANALMHVRHDAVVPYRTYGRIAGTDEFYLVLEYIDGDTLNDHYRRRKLTLAELFALARRLSAGLQAAHQEGLIHRDVSPDNVLLPDNRLDEATLIDFGIAKTRDLDDLPDQKFAGKLSYAAPEQFVPGGRLGPWTDIYSLALLLVAAARGQSLPMGRTIEEAQEARCAVPDLPGVPDALAGPLRKMLEPHPADRPQSMKDVLTMMIAAERKGTTTSPAPPPPKPPNKPPEGPVRRMARDEPPPRRHRAGGGIISVLLALLVGGAIAGGVMMYGNGMFGAPGGKSPSPPSPLPQPSPQPQPQASRTETLAKIMQVVRARLAAQPCSAFRLTGLDTGSAYRLEIGGAWEDGDAVKKAAETAATNTGADIVVSGGPVGSALCNDVELLKPLLAGRGAPLLIPPVAAGQPDRSVVLTVVPDPTRPYIYLFEADSTGHLTALADLGPAGRPKLVTDHQLVQTGDGHLQLVLKPGTASANLDQTILLAVASADTLPASMAGAVATPLSDWIAALGQPDVTTDVVPRDGVYASVGGVDHPPITDHPPEKSRDDLLAEARTAITTRLDAEPCNLYRLRVQDGGPPFQFTIGGVWGDASRMQQAAAEAASSSQANVILAGATIDKALCGDLQTVRAAAPQLGAAIMGSPQQPEADGSVSVVLAPAKETPEFYLLEVGKDGRVAGVLDLGASGLDAALAKGVAARTPDGRLKVKLPSGGAERREVALLIAVSAGKGLAAAIPSKGAALQDWTAQLTAAKPAGLSLDVAERPAVAGAVTGQPDTSGQPVSANGLSAATHDRFQAMPCSLIRVVIEGQGAGRSATVAGLWGDADAVGSMVREAGNTEHMSFATKGGAVASRHCGRLDGLKPFFKDGEPQTLTALTPGPGNDGLSVLTIRPDPAYGHLDLVWIDPQGGARSLFDLADAATTQRFRQRGFLTSNADGSISLIVPPFSADPGAPSGLFVAVASKEALPAEMLADTLAPFKTWQGLLARAAAATALRIDAVEYRQAGRS